MASQSASSNVLFRASPYQTPSFENMQNASPESVQNNSASPSKRFQELMAKIQNYKKAPELPPGSLLAELRYPALREPITLPEEHQVTEMHLKDVETLMRRRDEELRFRDRQHALKFEGKQQAIMRLELKNLELEVARQKVEMAIPHLDQAIEERKSIINELEERLNEQYKQIKEKIGDAEAGAEEAQKRVCMEKHRGTKLAKEEKKIRLSDKRKDIIQEEKKHTGKGKGKGKGKGNANSKERNFNNIR